MKSTSGAHYLGLDHVRAVAAFMVVAWHFTHGPHGSPVAFNALPLVFPLVLFDEGHVGVALFMTLSGYLFAKLLDGKTIVYSAFLWNRCLRLVPLLAVVMALEGARRWHHGDALADYAKQLAQGVILPVWPNGGWSIAVEFHYYLLLPTFLWLQRRRAWWPLLIVAIALAFRLALLASGKAVQPLAYWTIVGRVDQFALGMVAFRYRGLVTGRHALITTAGLAFCAVYTLFDRAGGFWVPGYPSKSVWWVFLPTLEGLMFAAAIGWYDTSFSWRSPSRAALLVAKAGEYSYSIYLLHFFVVFKAAAFIHARVMDLSNFYAALAWSTLFFAAMTAVGHLSFRVVESPFLKLRHPYDRALRTPVPEPALDRSTR